MKKLLILLNSIVFITSFSTNYYQYNIPGTQTTIGNGDIVYATKNDPSYNGVSFNLNGSGSPFDVLFKDSTTTDYLNSDYHAFQKMKFVGADPNNKNTVSLKKFSTGGSVGTDPIYKIEKITLENVILKPDELDLVMKGTKGYSQIDMFNSEMDLSQGKLMLDPGSSFILNSIRGSNKINTWNYNITNDFEVSVIPNSELTFSNSSLNLNGDTFININSGKLTIEGDSSNFLMKDKNSIINLTSGELLVKDTDVTVELQNLDSDLGKITVDGNNAELNLYGTTKIRDTSISLERGSIQIDKVNLSGANGIEIEANTNFNISNGISDGVLVINNSKGGTFKLSDFDINSGTVVYNGSNNSNENDFGTTNINNGTLKFSNNTALMGDLFLNNGYLKFDHNSLTGNLKGNGGTISGTIHVIGNADLSGSVYETSLNTSNIQESDLLSSNSSINGLNSITVKGDSTNAKDYENKKFTVASAPTISGNKNIVHDPTLPALLDFDVIDDSVISGQDVTLVGKIKSTSSLSNHSSLKNNKNKSNAQKVVKILPSTTSTTLTPGAQKLQNALLTMTNAQVYQNLNSLHAEPYSSHLTVGLEQNDLFLNTVMDRSRPQGNAYTGKTQEINLKNNLWIDTAYVEGKVNGEDDLGDFKYSLTNFILGGDLYEKDQLILGLYTGYGKHKMREHDMVDQEFETDTYHFGGYGSYIYKDFIFTGMFGYSYGNNQSERDITIGTESGTSKDKFDSHSIYTGLRGAYPIEIAKNTTLTPNLGLSYSYLYQEEIVESGFDMADLRVDSARADSFITSVGLNLSYDGTIKSVPVRPIAFVRYEHDWSAAKDSTHDIRAGFVHTPDSMTTFSGQNRGKNLVLIGIGVEVEVTPVFMVGGGVNYSDDSNGDETGVGFNFEYLW